MTASTQCDQSWINQGGSMVPYGAIADHLLIDDLRKNDFRKGGGSGAPWECFHPSGHRQNPVYMTTVTCPYIVFRSMSN